MQHLLGIEQLTAGDIEHLLSQTDRFVEVSRRRMPKVPALRSSSCTSAAQITPRRVAPWPRAHRP